MTEKLGGACTTHYTQACQKYGSKGTKHEKPQRGKIIAAGQGKSNENGVIKKLNVKKGDEVFYKKWGGTELKIENKNYLLMKEEDIIALIQE
jgi:chaperonin GroES